MKKIILILTVIFAAFAANAQTANTTQNKPKQSSATKQTGYNSGDPSSPNVHGDIIRTMIMAAAILPR